MVTVNHVVRSELLKNPFLTDLLQQNLLNVSALAMKFEPRVTAMLGRSIKRTAISMAIRRCSEEFTASSSLNWKFPPNLSITSKSNIYEVSFAKNSQLPVAIFALQKQFGKRPGSFLSVVDGIYETVLLTNQWNKELVNRAVGKSKLLSEKDDLGYVSIDFEPFTKDVPGIYYQLTRALAFNSISIQSMHTIGAEVIFLFDWKALPQAYETINALIRNKPFL